MYIVPIARVNSGIGILEIASNLKECPPSEPFFSTIRSNLNEDNTILLFKNQIGEKRLIIFYHLF